jgi:hypothetical protein
VEEFRTSIFERTKKQTRKRLLYNLSVVGFIVAAWTSFFLGFPLVGLKTAIGVTVAMGAMKLYDDKYMGITAYGERKGNLIIAEEYLEINEVKINYSDVTELVIYVEEYLGMPREIFGIHHGGNNKIEFNRHGKTISFNYIIKNKQDYQTVSQLVDRIENNPALVRNLKKLE